MKKKIISTFYIIALIILIIIARNILINKNETEQKELTFEERIQKIPYYKDENIERYKIYKEKNQDFSDNEIITYVNIGLDNPYYTNTKEAERQHTTEILVNKYNYISISYVPKNLETINTKYANNNMLLTKEAKDAFEKLAAAAASEDYTITVMSAYRSYEYQQSLYNRYLAIDGQELTDTYSARAGHSEHQTGLAIDVYNKNLPYTAFENTQEFYWMKENAYKYGYILRYPKDKEFITGYQYEPWHYRYVGVKIATYLQENNITYDEYYIRNLEQ